MKISGLQKMTLLDYPGKVACTVFTGGCNFRCPFCHNGGIVLNPGAEPSIPVEKVFDLPFERSPFNQRNLAAYRQLKDLINEEGYDVVHSNTPVGGIAGRLAARKARKKGCQVLYTAHGFHFFKGGPRKSWLVYYPIEKFMCRFASHIHGIGANTRKYTVPTAEEIGALRQELGIGQDRKVIICTGELNANKNQITALRAMTQVIKEIPEALLLLAGNGPTHDELETAVHELGLEDHAILLGYHTDLERYVKASDLVLSCSKREGLGLNLVEGMLCRKACVASVNRGHRELIADGENGWLLDPMDANGFAERIILLLKDRTLAEQFGSAGLAKAQRYTDESVYGQLEQIYRKRGVL